MESYPEENKLRRDETYLCYLRGKLLPSIWRADQYQNRGSLSSLTVRFDQKRENPLLRRHRVFISITLFLSSLSLLPSLLSPPQPSLELIFLQIRNCQRQEITSSRCLPASFGKLSRKLNPSFEYHYQFSLILRCSN